MQSAAVPHVAYRSVPTAPHTHEPDSRKANSMLSRTADHLFWMSRYMERAENTARMLDVNYQTSLLPQSAAAAEIEDFRKAVLAKPDGYIAQPTLSLSTCPTYVESGVAPRHIDLRPFVLSGKTVQMVPGGLTRVALKEGSLVVNSSQGGGTKDTWILEA